MKHIKGYKSSEITSEIACGSNVYNFMVMGFVKTNCLYISIGASSFEKGKKKSTEFKTTHSIAKIYGARRLLVLKL